MMAWEEEADAMYIAGDAWEMTRGRRRLLARQKKNPRKKRYYTIVLTTSAYIAIYNVCRPALWVSLRALQMSFLCSHWLSVFWRIFFIKMKKQRKSCDFRGIFSWFFEIKIIKLATARPTYFLGRHLFQHFCKKQFYSPPSAVAIYC
jgi:hypothetical protein